MISLDTETTGLDLHHGAKPFYVTICDEEGQVQFWEWDVDPETRDVSVPPDELQEIKDILGVVSSWGKNDPEIRERHIVALQNAKFDARALNTIGIKRWPWSMTRDTLLAGHLLASNQPHDLTSMAMHYLGEDIEPLEVKLAKACDEARRYCRSHLKDWMIAKKDLSCMPSAKEKTWKFDTWLPRTLVKHLWESSEAKTYINNQFFLEGLGIPNMLRVQLEQVQGWEYRPPLDSNSDTDTDLIELWGQGHPWWTVLQNYANADSEVTLALWKVMKQELIKRNLWAIYQERLKVLPIVYKMESQGVTISKKRLDQLTSEYQEGSESAGRVCVNIAKSYDYDLELPKSGNNISLRNFVFDVMELPALKRSDKTDEPSLDKGVIEAYEGLLPENSKQLTFIKNLRNKRKRDTACNYLEGYTRFWVPIDVEATRQRAIEQLKKTGRPAICYPEWYVLYPSINPTGTATLRFSSNNPNEQNIAKQEGFNLRFCFGPVPGREWWSLDAKNIELRIPAYEAGEEAFIVLFERPDDAPYYGSNHLLIAHLLHPEKFEACRGEDGQIDGRIFKKKYASNLYQRIKNGNFAVQYGAVDRDDGLGTADRAYGVKGAQALIKGKFVKQEALNQKWIRYADKYGYVETMPDKTVDPKRGYPIMCQRTTWGRVKPTVPLNYHTQSTAMWWMMKAMIRVQAQLDQWRKSDGFDAYIVMQVHDELVLDLPKSVVPPNPKAQDVLNQTNLWRIKIIQKLMEQGGDDIGVPTPVSMEYHPVSWDVGISF